MSVNRFNDMIQTGNIHYFSTFNVYNYVLSSKVSQIMIAKLYPYLILVAITFINCNGLTYRTEEEIFWKFVNNNTYWHFCCQIVSRPLIFQPLFYSIPTTYVTPYFKFILRINFCSTTKCHRKELRSKYCWFVTIQVI